MLLKPSLPPSGEEGTANETSGRRNRPTPCSDRYRLPTRVNYGTVSSSIFARSCPVEFN